MQLALGALKLFGLGGGAAAGGTALGLGTSSGASILSGVATVGSILSTLAAGNTQAQAYEAAADQARFDAQQEEVEGVRRASRLKQTLLTALGENDVAYAASGIDISGGVAADNRAAAERLATSELTIDRQTTDARRAMLTSRAAGYTRLASSTRAGALFQSLGLGAQAGFRLMQRGAG